MDLDTLREVRCGCSSCAAMLWLHFVPSMLSGLYWQSCTDVPLLPHPPQVLMSFKKAYELNGKPEVYGPLASCADALVRWMVVRRDGCSEVWILKTLAARAA